MTTTVANPTMTGQEIVDLTKKHTLFEWSAQSKVDPIPVAKAKGIYFWTPEGKRFIDFNSQLMSVNIGHGDERVIQAIHEQAQTLAYANPFMATEPRARLGAKLAEITPGDIDTFFFTNGGAEANENAIKIARFFTGRHKIMARYRSYHGATAGSMSLTGDPRRWAAEPGIPGVVRVLDPYHGIERGWESAETSLAMIEETMQLEGPHTIAAFILETVVGTNGILIPPDGYMQGVRKLCDKYGILMIADEVMAGFGRTGEWFAIDHWKVVPDLICMAKGLTASYLPLGAVGMRHHIAQHFQDKVFLRRPHLQLPSHGLCRGAGDDPRIRRRQAHRQREEDGRDPERTRSRNAGQASLRRCRALDRPVRNLRTRAQPQDSSAHGALQRNVRRNGGVRPLFPRAGTLYAGALEHVLYESSALHQRAATARSIRHHRQGPRHYGQSGNRLALEIEVPDDRELLLPCLCRRQSRLFPEHFQCLQYGRGKLA